ncbi:MAG: sulfur oxidation c-type cytochrome SoxA [Halioglobus sp.]
MLSRLKIFSRKANESKLLTVFIVLGTSLSALGQVQSQFHDKADLDPDLVRSGTDFLTESTRQMQHDSFGNPGLLWVDRGKALFEDDTRTVSCKSCHEDRLTGVFARFPTHDEKLNTLTNIEGQINQCRTQHQALQPLKYESTALLSLTAYIASQSRDMPYSVSVDGGVKEYFDRGREYFFTRRGQLNLACTQCHDDNWGRMLRGDRISQGHSNAYPAYRLEWQTMGSLHRRIADCDVGVRAAPFASGSPEYLELELYLAWRSANLPIESPGVRR